MFLKFQNRFPDNKKLKIIFSENLVEIQNFSKEETGRSNAVYRFIKKEYKILRNLCKLRNSYENFDFERLKEAHFYYTSNIGSVEIQFKTKLCKLFFRIPPM